MKKELYQKEMCKYCKWKDNCTREDIIIHDSSMKCNNYEKKNMEKRKYIEYIRFMYYDEERTIECIN